MNSRFKFVVVSSSTFLVVLLLVGAMRGRSASPEDTYRHLAVYTEVLSRIKSDYVEEPDMKSVTQGAVNGMLEAIDPYASYLSADQYKSYLEHKGAAKGDVGLVLSKRAGYIAVVSALPGGPAAQAGVSAGDFIETIKGVATRDMPLAFAEETLQGDPGTTIEISLFKSRRPDPQEKMVLKELYDEELKDFSQNPKRMKSILAVGEYPLDKTLNPVQLAAGTIVASTVMNFDEFLIKR